MIRNMMLVRLRTGGSHQFSCLRRYNALDENDSKIGKGSPLFGA